MPLMFANTEDRVSRVKAHMVEILSCICDSKKSCCAGLYLYEYVNKLNYDRFVLYNLKYINC